MHVPPGSEQFNNNVADIFQEKIRNFPILFSACMPTDHNFAARDLFDDGIILLLLRQYRQTYLFTLYRNT